MNATALTTSWSQWRVWVFVAGALLAQVGLVFWLGDKTPVVPRRASNEPRILLAPDSSSEFATLNDPTLFVWANPNGFSGTAWLRVPPLEYQAADWTEPPRYLQLQTAQLGNVFRYLVQTKATAPVEIARKPEVSLATAVASAKISIPSQSTMRVEGDLAGRRLLSQFDLSSVPASDILADSVVQVIVDARGQVQSATLLASSGSKDADARALDLAKATKWEPVQKNSYERASSELSTLSWGQLVFSWLTVPVSATNSPATLP